MKKFSFRLERVRQLRVAAEQEAARGLADARGLEDACREAVDAGMARLRDALAQVVTMHTASGAAGMLGNLHLPLDVLRARLDADTVRLQEAGKAVETARLAYDAARQDRMALDRLHDQRRAEWEREVARHEQAALDEVALRMSGQSEWQA